MTGYSPARDGGARRRVAGAAVLGFAALAAAAAFLLSTTSVAAQEGPIWFTGNRLAPQAAQTLALMRAAQTFGLRPSDYQLAISARELEHVLDGTADPAEQTRFDAALSSSAARFVTHLHHGRVSARAAGFYLPAPRPQFDPMQAVRALATSSDVERTLVSFEPKPPPYRLLKLALASYRELARQPQLTDLPALPRRSLAAGEEYDGVPKLRTLLIALGDLDAATQTTPSTTPIIDALQRFQQRHGLAPDGIMGPRTFRALTTPLQQRVEQIELALERWRWTAALERPDIVVNIPQFRLYGVPRSLEPGARMLEMPVIVGEIYPQRRTPVFVANLTHVIFQPYWDVPYSIMTEELLPRIRQDPAYLERHHMEIVRGAGDDAEVLAAAPGPIEALAAGRLRLRQRPGADNALGPVKFMLPNPHNVYLHGTPQTELFQRASRALSHGCIRVSDPAALAQFVLAGAPGQWTEAAIAAALSGNQTLRVNLTIPLRVVIFYGTALAIDSSRVMFFEDIYGHDRKLAKLLASGH